MGIEGTSIADVDTIEDEVYRKLLRSNLDIRVPATN